MDIKMDNNKPHSWIKALVVDDSKAICSLCKTILTDNYGVNYVHTTNSAPEALAVIKSFKDVNMFFLDLNMPGTDGVQLLKQIAACKFQGYIVIVSGVSTKIIQSVEDLANKYHLNFVGSIHKPIDLKDFDHIFTLVGKNKLPEFKSETQQLKIYEIIRALENDDIEVFYQPQVKLRSRKLVGVEALCRLRHPSLGLISPDKFIDKSEETDLIFHLTLNVIDKALNDWVAWYNQGIDITLSINISPYVLKFSEFTDLFLTKVAELNIPKNKICLEVTESIIEDNHEVELEALSRLAIKGVLLSLDDFGTGSASIERLHRLPFDELKLDKSFFQHSVTNRTQYDLIKSCVAMSNALDMHVVAEGIETAEHWKVAEQTGCDIVQGYYICKPIEASNINQWCSQWKHRVD
jgi:EAL domain-containing protein (putative c-di-GMP-specific phosphodiesterase class I)